MKITKSRLRELIKEEIDILKENTENLVNYLVYLQQLKNMPVTNNFVGAEMTVENNGIALLLKSGRVLEISRKEAEKFGGINRMTRELVALGVEEPMRGIDA
jgi:hypothetical protein